MSRSATAREALIAELLGDFAELLDRAESVAATMDVARRGLVEAAQGLGASVEPIKAHTIESAARAQTAAVEHIRKHAVLIASQTLQTQTQAMTQAARTIAAEEIHPPLRKLVGTLDDLVRRTHQGRWETWATYAATAAVSAMFTAAILGALLQK